MEKEYYPSATEILSALDTECILVGSASTKPHDQCKDIDFVISEKGLSILKQWEYWLTWDSSRWAVLIPYEENSHKTLEFFAEVSAIEDKSKWTNRLTYDQASLQDLKVCQIYGVEILSI